MWPTEKSLLEIFPENKDSAPPKDSVWGLKLSEVEPGPAEQPEHARVGRVVFQSELRFDLKYTQMLEPLFPSAKSPYHVASRSPNIHPSHPLMQ